VAALKMLEGDGTRDESFGVFVLDLSLHTLQAFTWDRTPLRKAVSFASTMATSYYEANRTGLAAGKGSDDLDLAGSSEDLFKALTRIQQGYATTTALQALATAMGVIPGRKTILYFSDGLPAQSDANKVRLDAAIATANRYNVAIYPVDAVGLRVHSQEMANGEALRRAALADMDAAGSDLGGGSASNVGLYIQRSGTTSAVFNRIANGTGGFVVENTNDLRRGVTAIDADRRFYYLLTYNPTNKELDGTWRAVTVTVPHRQVIVRARSGYIAAIDPK
jgi:VWFA-related protein